MRPLIALLIVLLAVTPVFSGDCIGTAFCQPAARQVVVQQAHHVVYPQVYYVPYNNQAYGSFMSSEDKFAAAAAKAFAAELDARGFLPAAQAQSDKFYAVDKYCGKCHGAGKNHEAAFSVAGDWTFEKANLAQRAFAGDLEPEGIPNMQKKAGIDQDADATKAVLLELMRLPNVAKTQKAPAPAPAPPQP